MSSEPALLPLISVVADRNARLKAFHSIISLITRVRMAGPSTCRRSRSAGSAAGTSPKPDIERTLNWAGIAPATGPAVAIDHCIKRGARRPRRRLSQGALEHYETLQDYSSLFRMIRPRAIRARAIGRAMIDGGN